MTAVTVLTLRGIGEPLDDPTNTCTITAERMRTDTTIVDVPWSATYGPVGGKPDGQSFARTVDTAISLTHHMIVAASNPVIVIGYSGGATVAGHLARAIHEGRFTRDKLIGVGLIADPHMPKTVGGIDAWGDPAWGVAGSRETGHTIPAVWSWSPADPIPCTAAYSPLRTFADQSAAMSLADPAAWATDLVDRLKRNRWQPSAIDWRLPHVTLHRYARAIDAARRYLTGDHVDPYRRGTQLDNMVAQLDRIVSDYHALP